VEIGENVKNIKNSEIGGALKGLYFIIDRTLSKKGVIEDVISAIKGGVRIVQYREKNLSDREMLSEAKKICQICRKNGVLFIVDDRVDIALACDADGVHIGKKDIDFLDARRILGKIKSLV
jgi:thiamine-phosphate pyrophosphorylase